MFVTNPTFEEFLPKGLGAPKCQYWRAMVLSHEAPWFLLTRRVEDEAVTCVETVAVAWELTLMSLIEDIRPESVVALRWLVRGSPNRIQWEMKDISELWFPSQEESVETGPLLLRIRGDEALVNCVQLPVASTRDGRRLLARIER